MWQSVMIYDSHDSYFTIIHRLELETSAAPATNQDARKESPSPESADSRDLKRTNPRGRERVSLLAEVLKADVRLRMLSEFSLGGPMSIFLSPLMIAPIYIKLLTCSTAYVLK